MGNVTGTTALVLNAGTGGVAINSTGAGDIVVNSDDKMLLDSDTDLEINSSAGPISIGNDAVAQAINVGTGGAARTITIGNATGATEIDVNTGTGGFKVDTQSGGGISLDAVAAASNLTVSTGGADEKDLTLSVAGGGNSSLFITSTGTGADSLEIDTTAGSMTIAKSLADGQTLKVGKNGAVEMIFSPHGTAANEKWSLINTSGDADDAVKIQAVAGGLDIDAGTVLNIDSASSLTATSATGDVNIVAEANNAKVRLRGDNATGVAIHLDGDEAEASIVDIDAGQLDIDASDWVKIDAADEIELTTTSADGHISIVTAHTSGVAFHLDADANAGSIVDIDAGILDIDAAGEINIDAGGALFLEGTGDSRIQTATSGNLTVQSAAILNHTGATGVNITATTNSVAISANTEIDLDAPFVDINAGATGLDVDAGAGGIAVDTSGTLSLDSADTTNLTMTANSGPAKTLTIDAINSGAGTASITVGATSGTAVNIGHSTSEVNIGDNLNVAGNTIITGDLTVNGATTTISTTNLNVEDALIVLQAELGSGVANATDIGIIMERGSSGDNAAIIWDEGADKFLLGTTTETGADTDVTVAAGTVQVGKLEIDGTTDHIDVSTDLIVTSAADITLAAGGANVKPNANNTIALGVSGTAWSDLFLGVGAVVDFKAGDVTLTHVDTVGLLLNGSKQLQFGDSASHIKQVADGQLEIESDVSIQIDSPIVDFEDDGVILQFGDGDDVTLTHIHDTGLRLNTGMQLQFGDSATHIKQFSESNLEIESDASIILDTPTIDFEDDGVVLAFGDNSEVTLTHVHNTGLLLNSTNQLQFSDGNSQISNPGAGLKLTDHAVIEVEAATSIQLDSPIVDFEDDGVVLQFGDGDDVTLTHVHNTGLLLNSGMKIQFGHADEHISGDATDLTVGSGGDINLTATGDVNLPASVGLTFGADTNKIEVDGSHNLSIVTANDVAMQTGGASGDQFLLRNGADTTENTRVCVGDASTYIERQGGSNNVNFSSNRPITVSAGGALNLYGSAANFKTQAGGAPVFNIALDTDTILLANHANDIVFKTNPGSATEIARFDTSESSLLMPTSNKVQFREATNFVNSSASNTLDIEAGSSNNGTINIGTDQASNINIGKVGTTTLIEGLALGATISLTGDACRLTFDGSGTDPYIERTAGSVLRFTDGSNTNVTLSDLASNAVDATAFTTIAGHRQVINSARRLALIGSGSVGGTHGDEIYDYNATTNPSDAMFFVSGSISPVGGPGVKVTPHNEARRSVFDSDMVVSGSVSLRGIYSLDGANDVTGHPQSYVMQMTQTSATKGIVAITGDISMKSSDATIQAPSSGDLEFTTAGGQSLMVFDGPNNVVTIPSDSTSKLGFGANTRFISNPNGTNDIKIEATGNVDISGGSMVIGADSDGADRSIVFGHATLKSRMGIDDSADVFAINTDASFESGNDFEIDASGNVTLGNGDLYVRGGDIYGIEDGQLRLHSDTDVIVKIDADGDSTSKFKVNVSGDNTKFEVDESGNVHADGDLDIDGTGTSTFAGTIHAAGLQIDSATLVVDSGNNHVGIGTSSPSHALHVAGNNSNEAEIVVTQYRNSAADPSNFRAQFARGTSASPSIVQDDDIIGTLAFHAYDGADFNSVGAEIRCDVDGAPGSNDTPGRIHFRTTSDGSSSPTTRMTILSSGNVGIGTASPSSPFHLVGNFTAQGHILPQANNTYNLGSSGARFANIYTNDLNLCNEGRGNDVDGTSGNWTIQEGEDNLYVINNITGKRFKMMLQPVEDGE